MNVDVLIVNLKEDVISHQFGMITNVNVHVLQINKCLLVDVEMEKRKFLFYLKYFGDFNSFFFTDLINVLVNVNAIQNNL